MGITIAANAIQQVCATYGIRQPACYTPHHVPHPLIAVVDSLLVPAAAPCAVSAAAPVATAPKAAAPMAAAPMPAAPMAVVPAAHCGVLLAVHRRAHVDRVCW